ncbi:hypothetical protein [Thiofilum flexile]|uniref:hypothetical protein n=1 Tax=Thiofilum flexile TaxID=125627 RepID=UPI00038111D1|nr:hypothetical protein [Thiofilum flexile]
MLFFRLLTIAIFLALFIYTSIVITNHGLNLLPIFFGDMAKLEWPGQFNLDFMFMFAFSALWVSWRHRFSGSGLALGVLAFFGGALFLSAYLLIQSIRVGGDTKKLLLGDNLLK